jgi:gas vesicle protein
MTPAHVLKRLFLSLLIGAMAGDVITVLFAPNALTWFATPGTGTALCNCAETARETAQSLVRAQLVGTGIGGLVGMVLGELISAVWRSRKKKAAPVVAPPPV